VYIFGFLGCCRFVLSVPQPSDWLERLVSEMTTYYVSSGTFSTYSTQLGCRRVTAVKLVCNMLFKSVDMFAKVSQKTIIDFCVFPRDCTFILIELIT